MFKIKFSTINILYSIFSMLQVQDDITKFPEDSGEIILSNIHRPYRKGCLYQWSKSLKAKPKLRYFIDR